MPVLSKVTFRFPSKKIQFGYAEAEFTVADDMSTEELGREYARATLAFQSGEIDEFDSIEQAARNLFQTELGAKVVSEEETPDAVHEGAAEDGADRLTHSEKAAISSTPPWDTAAPKAAAKPWEAPSFNFGS